MGARLREEFRWKLLLLDYAGNKHAFYTCQWHWPRPIFLVYRLLVAAYVVGWNTYSFVVLPSVGDHPSMVFLTQWTYLLLAIYLVVALVVTVICMVRRSGASSTTGNSSSQNLKTHPQTHQQQDQKRQCEPEGQKLCRTDSSHGEHVTTDHIDSHYSHSECAVNIEIPRSSSTLVSGSVSSVPGDNSPMPWYLKLTWMLFNMTAGSTPLVSMVYFFVLYPYIRSENPAYAAGALDINLHGISTVIVVLEMCLAAIPVRLLHAVYPACFGAVYVIFSLIYWALDKENNSLYPRILDWNYPGITIGVLCGLLLIVQPLIQLLWFGTYLLKMYLYRKIYRKDYIYS